MANERLNIPSTLKVGYQKRSDTYSGKLAYVTYVNKKGDIAKQTSWDGWRDRSINPDDFENVPTEGFVLNRHAGGYKSGWNFRQSKCRVWDPRGFEIEITIENLLFILEECTSTKGKGLEGEFVYAWQGPELILLPTCCEDYRCSTELMNKQEKITVKDLKVGASYKGKEYDNLIYIGKMDWYIWETKEIPGNGYYKWDRDKYEQIRLVKMSTFVNPVDNEFIGYKKTDKLDYMIEENTITDDEVATYIEKFKDTAAYKSQGLHKIVLKYSQKEWEKFLNRRVDALTEHDLFFQKPEDDKIMTVRCHRKEIYEGLTLTPWLNLKNVNTWHCRDNGKYDAALAEFNANKQVIYEFKKTGYITFKDGRLSREGYIISYGDTYPIVDIPESEWCYLSDGQSWGLGSNLAFINKDNEVVNYWMNASVSVGKIKF